MYLIKKPIKNPQPQPGRIKMNAQSLFEMIKANELELEAPALFSWKFNENSNMEEVASFMYKGGRLPPQNSAFGSPPEKDNRPEKRYWEYVKKEMHTFLCTDNEYYKELWAKIDDLGEKSTKPIVAIISATIGSTIGVTGTIISGFVAVILYATLKIGKKACCEYIAKSAI